MFFISWGPPSSKQQAACLARSRQGGYNYEQKYVGSTPRVSIEEELKHELQNDGYVFNSVRVKLGAGQATFLKGREELKNWRHFQLGWASVDSKTPVKAGERFCVHVNELFAWVLTPLEIIYVKDTHNLESLTMFQKGSFTAQESLSNRGDLKGNFAFGSGTLEGHLLAGEEMFAIRWEEDNSVWYELLSFSKPAKLLSKATYPYVQWRQKLFANQSSNAMLRAISAPTHP